MERLQSKPPPLGVALFFSKYYTLDLQPRSTGAIVPNHVTTWDVTFGGVDEVGRDVAAVKLHPLDDLQLVVQRLPVLMERLHTVTQLDWRFVLIKLITLNISLLRVQSKMCTLTVMTPLRPTFFIAFEMMPPISSSPLAEIVATFKKKK